MANSDAVTSQPPPRPVDDGFTFRIPRVQEWTLGTVIVAALSFGIWMGTLNEKLARIEQFVNSANDGAAGIFVRLATIQKSIDFLDKNGPVAVSPAPIDIRIPPIEVRSNPPNQAQDSAVTGLLEYKLVQEMLKPEKAASGMSPSRTSDEIPVPSNSVWREQVKATALQQLERLEQDVKQNPKIPDATKTELVNLIDEQHQRVFSERP